MKQLKFAKPLPQLILDGIKNTTWRINDDKITHIIFIKYPINKAILDYGKKLLLNKK
jgi:hypothetical protein